MRSKCKTHHTLEVASLFICLAGLFAGAEATKKSRNYSASTGLKNDRVVMVSTD